MKNMYSWITDDFAWQQIKLDVIYTLKSMWTEKLQVERKEVEQKYIENKEIINTETKNNIQDVKYDVENNYVETEYIAPIQEETFIEQESKEILIKKIKNINNPEFEKKAYVEPKSVNQDNFFW